MGTKLAIAVKSNIYLDEYKELIENWISNSQFSGSVLTVSDDPADPKIYIEIEDYRRVDRIKGEIKEKFGFIKYIDKSVS